MRTCRWRRGASVAGPSRRLHRHDPVIVRPRAYASAAQTAADHQLNPLARREHLGELIGGDSSFALHFRGSRRAPGAFDHDVARVIVHPLDCCDAWPLASAKGRPPGATSRLPRQAAGPLRCRQDLGNERLGTACAATPSVRTRPTRIRRLSSRVIWSRVNSGRDRTTKSSAIWQCGQCGSLDQLYRVITREASQ